jgi:elongation factor Ts
MTKIDLDLIQKLRERTGIGMMDCKKALQETNGDIEAAIDVLRKKGALVAAKRAGNTTAEGLIQAYIHPGAQMGVLLEINCETDFVARTDDMKKFAHDVCMHIVAQNPQFISREQMSEESIAKERVILREQLIAAGKPEKMIEGIVESKINKFLGDICLLDQPFVKNDQLTIHDLLRELIAKMGENIKITRFCRFEVGKQA